MTTGDSGLSAALAALWERQRGEMTNRVAIIERALDALGEGRLAESERADAQSAAHKITGSAGSFGFARASQNARAIELALRNGSTPDDTARLRALASELRTDLGGRP